MCQIQTAFHTCGQLAEGRTVLCQSYQHTKGRYCDGFSSFSRPVQAPCPDCRAGRPHPPAREMSAAVQIQRCVRNNPTSSIPGSAANGVIAPRFETGKPADVGNATAAQPGPSTIPPTGSAPPITVTPPENDPATSAKRAEAIPTNPAPESIWPPPTTLEPPAATIPTNSLEPAKPTGPPQTLSELERAWRKLAPVPTRISSAGAIQKPSVAPAARRSVRGLAPKAKRVAPVAGMGVVGDPASLWRDLSGVRRAAGGDGDGDFVLGTARGGG